MNFTRIKTFLSLLPALSFPIGVEGKDESAVFPLQSEYFKPIVSLESWNTYSMNERKDGIEYANLFDAHFRRMRFGAKGNITPRVNYTFMWHYDRVGENRYASTKGSPKGIDIWNGYLTLNVFPETTLLHVHVGYLWAAVSREYQTSPWSVSSFDKTFAVWYLRYFVSGKANGIESGINLGGFVHEKNLGLAYRIGIYNPSLYTSPQYSSLLKTGRIMFNLGQAEQTTYKFMLDGNQWRQRKGVTIGVGASYQGMVDNERSGVDSVSFSKNLSYGADVAIHWRGWCIEGEHYWMKRTAANVSPFSGTEWHLRASYNVAVKQWFIEPSVMASGYYGKGNASLFRFQGQDQMIDAGVNWYIKKDKLKVTAHFILQQGTANENEGDYYGVAVQVKI